MDRYFAGVIFDLDGVITDTAEYHYQAWKRLADRLGLPFDRKINERLKGVPRMDSLNIILEKSPRVYSDAEKLQLASEKNADYVALISEITPTDLLPGTLELIQQLKAGGYKIGLASASKNAALVMDRLQIASYFDTLVDAATIKNGKPDPEIFLVAAEQLGLVPNVCIGVEDAQAGVKAIKAAGMFAVGVGAPGTLEGVDVMIPDLREFDLARYETLVKK